MKQDTLKLRPDFIGRARYSGLGTAPNQINGERGSYQRHILFNGTHGIFHVITKTLSTPIPENAVVEVIDPIFFEDRSLNGSSVAPALNVRATDLKIVQGGNN